MRGVHVPSTRTRAPDIRVRKGRTRVRVPHAWVRTHGGTARVPVTGAAERRTRGCPSDTRMRASTTGARACGRYGPGPLVTLWTGSLGDTLDRVPW